MFGLFKKVAVVPTDDDFDLTLQSMIQDAKVKLYKDAFNDGLQQSIAEVHALMKHGRRADLLPAVHWIEQRWPEIIANPPSKPTNAPCDKPDLKLVD